MKRELVPFYAQHLVAAGTVLPGTARPGRTDKVRIDWPAAAMATPGNGVAPALPRAAEDSPAGVRDGDVERLDRAGLAADGDLGEHGGITFEQWVAVSAGLSAIASSRRKRTLRGGARRRGRAWRDAEAAWMAAMMGDPRIGTRYGAAFEQARKRR